MRVRTAEAMMVLLFITGGACSPSFGLQSDQKAAPQGQSSSSPKPDSSGRYLVGNGVKPPKLIHSADPHFTEQARRIRLTGTCVLSLTVGTDGVPYDFSVIRSIAEKQPDKLRTIAQGLDANAIKAVEQYRFQPGTFEGKAVPVAIHVEVNFQLY